MTVGAWAYAKRVIKQTERETTDRRARATQPQDDEPAGQLVS